MSDQEKKPVESEPKDSIFAREQIGETNEPWWQRNFLLTKPTLFGTWDGVFTTVLVNIFGVIVFLRMGWIVGTAGVANAVLLLIICTSLALISVFSAIGICERCHIQSGGIYFLISHVLGGQIGGAVGLMYAFGQAVATGLVAIGFGESVARLLGSENAIFDKLIAIATLLLLTGINIAGIRWIIRLQLLLLAFLALAVIDFYLGALFSVDEKRGVGHFSTRRFEMNTDPLYSGFNCSLLGFDVKMPRQNFFTVFGVFFANFLGVLAGVNMSDDLINPQKNIPLGELSAVGVSSLVSLSFILILGSLVDRAYLLCDSMIAEKVSLTGLLFLAGLYVSSLSSTVGSLLGTPRVIQSIASEGIIPLLNPLAHGYGANRTPLRASAVMMLIAILFVIIGDLNQLAILSTMPFLITYAFVNYSYVSLAMSYDLQTVAKVESSDAEKRSYGSMGSLKGESEGKKESDLEQLFSERAHASSEKGQGSIIEHPATWYSSLSNRYVSFIGAIVNISLILLVNVWYALFHLIALAALYFYIGKVCPSVFPGISEFSLPHMFKTAFSSIEALGTAPKSSNIVLSKEAEGKIPVETTVTTLNEENPDYVDRKRYHHAEDLGELHD